MAMKLSAFAALMLRLIGIVMIALGIRTFIPLYQTIRYLIQSDSTSVLSAAFAQLGQGVMIVGVLEIVAGCAVILACKSLGNLLCKGLEEVS
jgi:hypothetical protein